MGGEGGGEGVAGGGGRGVVLEGIEERCVEVAGEYGGVGEELPEEVDVVADAENVGREACARTKSRAPFARRTFERYLRRVCAFNETRVTRTLAEAQGRAWDGGATTRWPEGDAPWSQAAMERMYGWIDGGARCAE